jgi:DegV family protein with EDD domain
MMTSKVIRFVADSTCDIPPELVKKWGIGIVPAFVNYGGRSYADDGVELDRVAYYNEMPAMKSQPTTSAPSPALTEQIIKQYFQAADHLVMLTVPATLSGIYNTFRLATAGLPQERITLIDCGTTSMGLGFQVLNGAEAAQQTGDLAAVLDAIQRTRQHVKVYAAPETLEYLRRSGRVGWAAAGAAAVLQIKAIVLAAEGQVTAVARVRTFSKAIDRLVELVQNQAPLDKLVLLHANNLDGIAEMSERLGKVMPSETYVINVTPVIGTHIGPKSLGAVALSQAWRS